MPFITQGKTNWKYILIVVVLAVITTGAIFIYQKDMIQEMTLLLKFHEIKKPEKVDETANWKTYINEKYGFEFEYPKEWISLELKSQENNEIYIFQSSNESIEKVFYFKPQKIIAFIIYGEDYSSICPEWDEILQVRPYSEILKILYSNKEIKTIYTTKIPTSKGCLDIDFIGNVSLSPNGEYIGFVLHGYEWSNSVLRNLNTGLDIYGASFYDPYKQVFWSSSSKTLAIISPPCEMEPCTTQEGIFVSDYGEPEKLNKILSLTLLDSIDDLYFVNDDKLFFFVKSTTFSLEKKEYEEKTTKYEYIIKTRELREIK